MGRESIRNGKTLEQLSYEDMKRNNRFNRWISVSALLISIIALIVAILK